MHNVIPVYTPKTLIHLYIGILNTLPAVNTNSNLLIYPFAAGYNVVIVESVGLGQSEVEIDNAVDMLVMIVPPGGGDGLQVRHRTVTLSMYSNLLSLITCHD